MRPYLILLVLSLLFAIPSYSFNDEPENKKKIGLKIKRATSEIKLDGIVEEASWKEADVATDFWQKNPKDDVKAVLRTEMRVTYNDEYLYVSAVCFDSTNHIITTLKRDIGFWNDDGVSVVLDPLNEATTGFMFGTNTYGVQTEVLLGGGSGFENYKGEWNNRWFVETKIYPDRWTMEMAIPFKTLRYETGRTTWGINFIRNDKKNNRQDVWAQIPRQFWMIDLGYTGKMEWDAAPKKANGNITIIPYVNASTFKNIEEGNPANNKFNVGVDAKIALSSSLNLDLTINPDFSQVEVDQQVTNLTRFSIFLPERRTFFIENSDIFSSFGIPPARPFFSRRIGLDENGNAVPIAFGLRLTGNVTSNTRIGLMNVQTKANENQLAQNYTAAAFNQRIFGRSLIKGVFINRQSFKDGDFIGSDYNRNVSLEFNYQSTDGVWKGWAGYHKSFKPGISGKNSISSVGASYDGKIIQTLFDWTEVGTNYFADVGFVNFIENYDALRDTTFRLGYNSLFIPITFRFLPENSTFLNQHSLKMVSFFNLDPDFKFVERSHDFEYEFMFKNSSQFSIQAQSREIDLRFPFSFTGEEPLPAGRYFASRFGLQYQSDNRKVFQLELKTNFGGFYNGNLTTISSKLLYRKQPWGNFGLEVEYNKLSFPDPYGKETIWAFSPRIEINFNRNLFWTTFFQYNTQADNFNINSRFQWRFAPMSDVFLVYTENYSVNVFGVKNRALVLKINYWLVI